MIRDKGVGTRPPVLLLGSERSNDRYNVARNHNIHIQAKERSWSEHCLR